MRLTPSQPSPYLRVLVGWPGHDASAARRTFF